MLVVKVRAAGKANVWRSDSDDQNGFGSMYRRIEAFLATISFDVASLALVLEPLILPII
jgi:hypothetical protein